MKHLLAHLLIWLIKGYQIVLSPLFGQQCRFSPTCSEYALQAVRAYGAVMGSYYAVTRLLKCHPWHAGGHDPIP